MSGFPPPLFSTCTTRPSRASCLPLPANFPFLVLIGFHILLPLVLFFFPRRVDLLVPPTERKLGQTSLLLLQFSWHHRSGAVLVILPTLVICIQLSPTLLYFSLLPNSCNQRLIVAFPMYIYVYVYMYI